MLGENQGWTGGKQLKGKVRANALTRGCVLMARLMQTAPFHLYTACTAGRMGACLMVACGFARVAVSVLLAATTADDHFAPLWIGSTALRYVNQRATTTNAPLLETGESFVPERFAV